MHECEAPTGPQASCLHEHEVRKSFVTRNRYLPTSMPKLGRHAYQPAKGHKSKNNRRTEPLSSDAL
ncbi:MAG TPA: hypothetical protein VMZ26_16505, partial [Pyrinomonadaceae bacterium]|nr:hypothetical protein [Pyrinomonadaceae bacterium]